LVFCTNAAVAQDIRVSEGSVEMRLDRAAPELTCVVVRTSGNAKIDDAACTRAIAPHRSGRLPYPKGVYFYGNAARHPAECRLIGGGSIPAELETLCAAQVAAMKKARFAGHISPETWLRASDLKSVPGPGGRGTVRLGINERGRATYCVVTDSSGNAALDRRACEAFLKRARYEPALNSDGQPTASTDHRRYVLDR
jgi:TonB family protein